MKCKWTFVSCLGSSPISSRSLRPSFTENSGRPILKAAAGSVDAELHDSETCACGGVAEPWSWRFFFVCFPFLVGTKKRFWLSGVLSTCLAALQRRIIVIVVEVPTRDGGAAPRPEPLLPSTLCTRPTRNAITGHADRFISSFCRTRRTRTGSGHGLHQLQPLLTILKEATSKPFQTAIISPPPARV